MDERSPKKCYMSEDGRVYIQNTGCTVSIYLSEISTLDFSHTLKISHKFSQNSNIKRITV